MNRTAFNAAVTHLLEEANKHLDTAAQYNASSKSPNEALWQINMTVGMVCRVMATSLMAARDGESK